MNQISKTQSTNIVTTGERNSFERYADAVSRTTIVGDLLKFLKGEYIAGQGEEEIPEGTKLVPNMDEWMIGWVKWQGGKPVDMEMGRVADGYIPPKRVELGDNNPDEWEVDAQGAPRDPWQKTNYLILTTPSMDRFFTFSTSSKGGRAAIEKLARQYGRRLHEHPDEYPVVALRVDSYRHRNKAYGKISVPVLDVVGWVPKAEFKKALAASHEGPDDEEPPTSSGAPALNGRGTSAPTVDTRF